MFTRIKEQNNKKMEDNTTTTTKKQQENQENRTTINKMNYKPGQETTTDVKKQ